MSLTLPLQPNLEHLKKQAKDLQKAHQLGDAAVCSTLRQLRHLAHASDDVILTTPLTLRQAQHALARAYGFSSWADMKIAIGTTTVSTTTTGGCFCGSVRYHITELSPKAGVCHCAGCRRASAAPAVAWITVKAESFQLLQGELRTVRRDGMGKDSCDGWGGLRGFCPTCGTHITYLGDDRQHEIDVTTGSLENPDAFPPVEESFSEMKLSWMKTLVG